MVKVEFAPFGAALLADPYPTYQRLQSANPVRWSDAMGGWVLTAEPRAPSHRDRSLLAPLERMGYNRSRRQRPWSAKKW